ncbi:MAG: alpha/beta hydrolase [Alphaproteobacteria bacterium]|nr:alpha/beta hydrolase [Alphaproteobacteria bacterium]MDD9919123.1 alpha/beta hydrolase [Alphaproteobacteria bacterium]
MKGVILHDSIGHPFENWFPWLAKRLTDEGWTFRVPQFPTPEGQNKDNWLKHMDEQVGSFIDEETVLIGHSGGALLLLNYLNITQQKLAGSVFVSTPFGPSNVQEFAHLDTTFLETDFNWEHIQKQAGKIALFHGDDDPVAPVQQSYDVSKHLGTDVTIVTNGGHLNSRAGYDTFPQLYGWIKKNFNNE